MRQNSQFDVPVALIVFNRYNEAKQAFEVIRQVRPKTLYIIADGPRKHVPTDGGKCMRVRSIFDDIDWDCNVIKEFSDVNLGCSQRPYTGISRVFSEQEQAIIIEDDMIASISFFEFAKQMLEKYNDDTRIGLITGINASGKYKPSDASYHFSKLGGTNGWASWRRVWQNMDIELLDWDNDYNKKLIKECFNNNEFYAVRGQVYDKLLRNYANTTAWDYQFGFSRIINNQLAVVPCVNMISNVGYGEDATHTVNADSDRANLKRYEMEFPLIHPRVVLPDVGYDKSFMKILSGTTTLTRVKRFVKTMIGMR